MKDLLLTRTIQDEPRYNQILCFGTESVVKKPKSRAYFKIKAFELCSEKTRSHIDELEHHFSTLIITAIYIKAP